MAKGSDNINKIADGLNDIVSVYGNMKNITKLLSTLKKLINKKEN
jgi:hypothetical protein